DERHVAVQLREARQLDLLRRQLQDDDLLLAIERDLAGRRRGRRCGPTRILSRRWREQGAEDLGVLDEHLDRGVVELVVEVLEGPDRGPGRALTDRRRALVDDRELAVRVLERD